MRRLLPNEPERHFDIRRLSVVFACASLALAGATVWIIADDHGRDWKETQAEFRRLERASVEEELAIARSRAQQAEVASLWESVAREETALAERREELDEHGELLAGLERQRSVVVSRSRSLGSRIEATRARLAEAVVDGGDEEGLRLRVGELEAELLEQRKATELLDEEIVGLEDRIEGLRSGLDQARERLELATAELRRLEARSAALAEGTTDALRDLPLVDFLRPVSRIRQVVLDDLTTDLHFTRAPRVDRCATCHLAADRPGFESADWAEPYRSHPRLDLFVGAGSPHPYERFGCTVCHGGEGRATEFSRAGHSPVDVEQEARWRDEHDWRRAELERPILPADLSEAGCVDCHQEEVWTPASQVQEAGRALTLRLGCQGCHRIDRPSFRDRPVDGPDLRLLASKVDRGWAYRYLEAPRSFRPATTMPSFFHLENVEGEASLSRQRAEIRALVAYLWSLAPETPPELPAAPRGDARRGAALFLERGCAGCHLAAPEATRDDAFPRTERLQGPSLQGTGSKLSPDWLYAWLRDPAALSPGTAMPDPRLTDDEAADLTAWLATRVVEGWAGATLPPADEAVRDGLLLDRLTRSGTVEAAVARVESLDASEREILLGLETVRKYGCHGCHALPGLEDEPPIGSELTDIGVKPLEQVDFGRVDDVPRTRHDWLRAQITRPRVWDRGLATVKPYDELLRMPDYGLSEREARAIVTNLLGMTDDLAAPGLLTGRHELGPGRLAIDRHACRACHRVEGTGPALLDAGVEPAALPPPLDAEGVRVQAEWLLGYLRDPSAVRLRPWLAIRMPAFELGHGDLDTLLRYFMERDGAPVFSPEPRRPTERSLALGRVAFAMLQCARCHPAGPGALADLTLQPQELAPSLLLARQRLRWDWVPAWIADPQAFVAGTRMPTNFAILPDGRHVSPLVDEVEAPMFGPYRALLAAHFESEEAMIEALGDVGQVTVGLRDHIWWGLR